MVTIATRGIGEEILGKIGHHRQRVRKLCLEECSHFALVFERRKAGLTVEREEQDAAEGAVDVRQRDQHECPARPDVQRMCFEDVFPVAVRRNRQLLVAIIEILLREVEAREL